jgi:hypothetical protein
VEDVCGAFTQGVVKSRVNGASASNRATDANDRNDGDDGDKRESCDLASGACEERLNAAFGWTR